MAHGLISDYHEAFGATCHANVLCLAGLLFMLASIPASSMGSGSSSWSVHSSSARAGVHGALVSAVPLKAFQEAFERREITALYSTDHRT